MTVYEVFSLLGGVALFLFGMSVMSSGLRNACGDNLRLILERATRNRVAGVLAGAGVTVLVQSSSATDVMVIGFVSSGLLTLQQAIGVIMGANIGTTITAQITAFNLGAFAPAILFVGTLMYMFLKRELAKHIGAFIMGFGMLFVGIGMMKSAIAPLAETEGFATFLSTLEHPGLLVIFGVLFTALLQSSSSSTVIFQAFAAQGIINYESAVYLLIGAALGEVTPHLLASLAANRNGKRCALLNLIFNLFRALILLLLIGFFPQLLTLIQKLSPESISRQIANTHTLFALVSVLLMLPFTKYIVKISQLIMPVRAEENRGTSERRLVYLTQVDKIPPAVAMTQVKQEIVRMGNISIRNLQASVDCFFGTDDAIAEQVEETENTVNYLDRAIIGKLVELRSADMLPKEMNRLHHMILVVADVERLSDHAENIVEYAAQLHSGKAQLSPVAMDELRQLAELSLRSVRFCLDIFEHEDFERLPEAEDLEERVDRTQEEIIQNHVRRLMSAACDPLGGVVFADMASDLERCSDHAINIATALSDHPS